MALGIPMPELPLSGLNRAIATGGNLFSQMMNPVIQREKMAQDLAMWKEEFAQRKKQAAQAHALDDLRRRLLEEKIKASEDKRDPNRILRQLAVLQGLGDFGAEGQPTGTESFVPSMPTIQQPQEESLINQLMQGGEGSYIPQMPTVEQPLPPEEPKRQGLFSPEELKEMFKAMAYKQVTGMNPPRVSTTGMTPEDRQRTLDLREKELQEKIRHNQKSEEHMDLNAKLEYEKDKSELRTIEAEKKARQKADLAYTTELNKKEAQQFSKMEDEAIAGIQANDSLRNLKETVNNPVFQNMNKHPYLRKAELWNLRKTGTDEQRKVLADFDIYGKKVIADTAKGLNTRFTNKDLAFAESMKITDSDTPVSAARKAEALYHLHELGQRRLEKAIDIARTTHMSPYDAFKAADKAIKGDEMRKALELTVYPMGNKTTSNTVPVYNPKGAIINIPASEINNLPKGWRRV